MKHVRTFRAFSDTSDTMVFVSAVFHLTSRALQLTQSIVSQFPVLAWLSCWHEVEITTFDLVYAPPASELHKTSVQPLVQLNTLHQQ